jgi:hypothetical protein
LTQVAPALSRRSREPSNLHRKPQPAPGPLQIALK